MPIVDARRGMITRLSREALPPASPRPAPLAPEVRQTHPEALVAGEAPEAVTDPWSLYDFFVVGIACDVVGAFFISRIFIRRSASFAQDFWTPGGINNELAIVGERTDAMFGVAVLLIGFLFQAVGYILLLDGVKAKSSGEAPALSSVIIAVTAVAVLLVVRRFSRQTIIRRTVVKFVMARPKADLPEAVWYMTVGSDFVKWGTAMGRPPLNEGRIAGKQKWIHTPRVQG